MSAPWVIAATPFTWAARSPNTTPHSPTLKNRYGIKKCLAPTHSWLDPRGCKRLCSVSLGYFVHDFLSLRSMWAEDPAMVIHHTMGILLILSLIHI